MNNNVIAHIQIAIEGVESRIASLESKIGLNGVDDMYLADKINYHLGNLSGLRRALFIIKEA